MATYIATPGNLLVLGPPVVNRSGATVSIDDRDAYSTSASSYIKDDIVKVGTSYLRCTATHVPTSAPATALSVTAGVIAGDDKENWQVVNSPGAIFRSSSGSWAESVTENRIKYIEDSDETVVSSSASGTITQTYSRDRENPWHTDLGVGFQVNFNYFIDGPVVGGQMVIGRASVAGITQTRQEDNTTAYEITLNTTGTFTKAKAVASNLYVFRTS